MHVQQGEKQVPWSLPECSKQTAWSITSPGYKFFPASPGEAELDPFAKGTLHFLGPLDLPGCRYFLGPAASAL